MSTGEVLVTGGAGFVGANLVEALVASGRRVLVYDNLSRRGAADNLDTLRRRLGGAVDVAIADLRDGGNLEMAVRRAGLVYHLAAQVAVTTSLTDPVADFGVNAGGTLGLLEAVRRCASPPPVIFTSTNKVYGALAGLDLAVEGRRYWPRGARGQAGIDESWPLDFQSPYGCSKGAADQYVLDYARSYGLDAVVLRMSCIYGPYQRGNEDQGWVAHFARQALEGRPIRIFGDGRQVRDLLYVGDLVEALRLAEQHMDRLGGRAFNMGGGPANAVSLVEILDRLGAALGAPLHVEHGPWRTGDQRFYVADHGAFSAVTGWRPRVSVEAGLGQLVGWLRRDGVARPAAMAAAI